MTLIVQQLASCLQLLRVYYYKWGGGGGGGGGGGCSTSVVLIISIIAILIARLQLNISLIPMQAP